MMNTTRKYEGQITWVWGRIRSENPGYSPFTASIKRGIQNPGEFKIEYNGTNEFHGGLIVLKGIDEISFSGSMFQGTEQPAELRNFKFYSNSKGAILIGDWIENTNFFTCIIEMVVVQDFK